MTPQEPSLIETLKDSEPIFKGRVISLFKDTVTLPNGNIASREVVRHPGAVAVLAITIDNRVVLVRQYRHACGKILLEVPAGKLDLNGESPQRCAFRELAEETPYTAQNMTLIHTFYTAAGFCDEIMYLYQATGLQANSQSSTDEDEFVETVYLTQEEVKKALQERQIEDSKTIIALQHWLLSKC